MKIAVTYENGNIFGHFGRTQQFKLYEVVDGKVVDVKVVNTNGTGHGALAGMLAELGAQVLICGGMGGGAKMAMARAGIKVCGGVSGNADEAVAKYLAGTLAYDEGANCDHHHHNRDEGHQCGDQGCGSHDCHH